MTKYYEVDSREGAFPTSAFIFPDGVLQLAYSHDPEDASRRKCSPAYHMVDPIRFCSEEGGIGTAASVTAWSLAWVIAQLNGRSAVSVDDGNRQVVAEHSKASPGKSFSGASERILARGPGSGAGDYSRTGSTSIQRRTSCIPRSRPHCPKFCVVKCQNYGN